MPSSERATSSAWSRCSTPGSSDAQPGCPTRWRRGRGQPGPDVRTGRHLRSGARLLTARPVVSLLNGKPFSVGAFHGPRRADRRDRDFLAGPERLAKLDLTILEMSGKRWRGALGTTAGRYQSTRPSAGRVPNWNIVSWPLAGTACTGADPGAVQRDRDVPVGDRHRQRQRSAAGRDDDRAPRAGRSGRVLGSGAGPRRPGVTGTALQYVSDS